MANILLIEDNDDVALLFVEGLEKAGHHVERASDAYEAVLLAVKTPPDVAIVDLLLRGPNGAVAALALRGLGLKAPVIVATGGLVPIDQTVYDRAGFAGRLLKPCKISELVAEVAKQLAAAEE